MKYVFYEHPAWALKLLGFLCVSLSVPGPAVHKRQRSTAVWIGPGWALVEETRNLGSRVWGCQDSSPTRRLNF